MENERKTKKDFWVKVKSNAREALLELLFGFLALAIGAGIFVLLGKGDLVWQMDWELLVLLGSLVILAVVIAVAVIINHVKKNR